MPRKIDKYKIEDPFLSRRTKLLPCQKERILMMNAEGISSHKLAKIFKVSRRLIQFTIDPIKRETNKQKRKENGISKKYYSSRKNSLSLIKHRKYKEELFKHLIMKHKVEKEAEKILAQFKNNRINCIEFLDNLIVLNWHLIRDVNFWLDVKKEVEKQLPINNNKI